MSLVQKNRVRKQQTQVQRAIDQYGDDHPVTLRTRVGLAQVYRSSGLPHQALPIAEAAHAAMGAALAASRPGFSDNDLSLSRSELAGVYEDLGRYEDAIPLREGERELWLGRQDEEVASYEWDALFTDYSHLPDKTGLLDLLAREEKRVTKSKTFGPESPVTAIVILTRGALDRKHKGWAPTLSGPDADAQIAAGQAAVERLATTRGARHPDTLEHKAALAGTYVAAGCTEEALLLREEILADALAISKGNEADRRRVASAGYELGRFYLHLDRPAEAVAPYRTAWAGFKELKDQEEVRRVSLELCDAYYSTGQMNEAMTYASSHRADLRHDPMTNPRSLLEADALVGLIEGRWVSGGRARNRAPSQQGEGLGSLPRVSAEAGSHIAAVIGERLFQYRPGGPRSGLR